MAAARRISHDQLLKEALTAFLPDFVTLFAPDQAALLDFSHIRFLDKELFTDLAAGDSREVDVLAEVRTREGGPPRLILIHVEIQRERHEAFAQRMLRYFLMIRLRFPDRAILPLALVSYPTAQGISVVSATVTVAGFTTLVYNYIEISLPSLDPQVYLGAPQPLAVGLAPLMRVPRPACLSCTTCYAPIWTSPLPNAAAC